MKNTLIVLMIAMAFMSFINVETRSARQNEIHYPDGFRSWTHVKTTLAGKGSPNFSINGGYHHIYANDIAMQGYTSGQFKDGAMMVFDVIDIKEQGSSIIEAGRKRIDVMVKDSLKYSNTGGWGFGEFIGDDQVQVLTPLLQNQCYSCHAQTENSVFSIFRK